MTNREPKKACPYCEKAVRQIGKHINQKHKDKFLVD